MECLLDFLAAALVFILMIIHGVSFVIRARLSRERQRAIHSICNQHQNSSDNRSRDDRDRCGHLVRRNSR